jgi:methylated-DNA-protein-cysteine methyltransferase-like protein
LRILCLSYQGNIIKAKGRLMSNQQNFFADVYEVVKLIPPGRVTSYGAIAAYLGTRGSARMVGWAMNAAHGLADVPAHRVVNSKGLLTGKHHFGDPNRMEELLAREGVIVKDDQIQEFANYLWDPVKELEL